MSNYGVKVTLPGYDIATATPEQCALHSKYPCPKVKVGVNPGHYGTLDYSFSADIAASTTLNILTVAHNLGFVPMVICSWKYDFGAAGPPVGTQYGDGRLDVVSYELTYFDMYADSTNFYIDFNTAPGSVLDERTLNPFQFRYYIFSEDGA